jgi:hypothetical protein
LQNPTLRIFQNVYVTRFQIADQIIREPVKYLWAAELDMVGRPIRDEIYTFGPWRRGLWLGIEKNIED